MNSCFWQWDYSWSDKGSFYFIIWCYNEHINILIRSRQMFKYSYTKVYAETQPFAQKMSGIRRTSNERGIIREIEAIWQSPTSLSPGNSVNPKACVRMERIPVRRAIRLSISRGIQKYPRSRVKFMKATRCERKREKLCARKFGEIPKFNWKKTIQVVTAAAH